MMSARVGLPACVVAAMVCLGALSPLSAADDPLSLEERAAGAQRIVVARTLSVEPRLHRNAFGDQLIVSRVLLQVEETLKGPAEGLTWVDVEGGTLGGVTLRVSDQPEINAGERAVFFLDAAQQGVHSPHRRGQGILKLDDRELVPGSSLHLSEIRRVVAGARGMSR